MLALADPPDTQPGLIPGLKYPPEWHRVMEELERSALNSYIRRHLLRRLPPTCG